MKTELKYTTVLFAVLFASISGMLILLKKYSYLTIQHFVEFCRQQTADFLSSSAALIGVFLLLAAFLLALIFFAKFFFSLKKTQRKILFLLEKKEKNLPSKIQQLLLDLKINRNKIVVVKQKAPLALSFGIVSPKILISTGLIRTLPKPQLEAVLLHEIYHLRNKHPLLLIFAETTAAVLFFIPLVKEIVLRMRLRFEQNADNYAIKIQGTSVHLKLALAGNIIGNSTHPYPGLAGELLKRRINLLTGNKIQKLITLRSISLSTTAVLAGLILFLFPTSTPTSTHASFCSKNKCNGNCFTQISFAHQSWGLDKR